MLSLCVIMSLISSVVYDPGHDTEIYVVTACELVKDWIISACTHSM